MFIVRDHVSARQERLGQDVSDAHGICAQSMVGNFFGFSEALLHTAAPIDHPQPVHLGVLHD